MYQRLAFVEKDHLQFLHELSDWQLMFSEPNTLPLALLPRARPCRYTYVGTL